MVESDFYIKKIISIDTLLSFNGIIPSFSAFQQKAVRLIKQLQMSLHNEGIAEADIQRLCWLIAIWLDKRTVTRLDHNFYSWGDYSLEHALYEYKSKEERFVNVFTEVLENASQPVKRYACRIALLYSALTPHDQTLMAVLATIPVQLSSAAAPVTPTVNTLQTTFTPPQFPQALPVRKPLRRFSPLAECTGLLAALLILWMLSIVYLGSLF